MTTAPKIHETVAQMARPKTVKRPSSPRLETGLVATMERTAKGDYQGPIGKRSRCNHLLTLRKAGELDAEAETLAERWLSDYQFGVHGYTDAMHNPLPSDYIRGDAITFATSRGIASERVGLVRDNLGDDAHDMLVRLLSLDQSFASIAREKFPARSKTSAEKAIRERAVVLLQILPSAYKSACRLQKQRKEQARR